MIEYRIGPEGEIAEGGRRVVQCGAREVGVFRIGGELRAWFNTCPHRQGPVCQGRIYARVVEPVDEAGRVRLLAYDETRQQVVCPWHGYEFDLRTGACQGTDRLRLFRAEVKVEDGIIYVVA